MEDTSESSAQVDVTVRRDPSRGTEYNQFLVCGALFECPAKYLPIKPIGKGAYGVVCSARNLLQNDKVAIKKIAGAFENVIDAKRTLREIKLLRHLQHENIVQIKDIIPPTNRANFKDVYVVYELMDTDLHQIIRSPQHLSDDHVQYFLYQVLRGLKFIHSANILHRDLKPSNLLVNANCDLKICDFGLARTSNQVNEFMTEYVVTRWYRAPELLLSCSDYSTAIDVWSVGCIFAELLGRKPLFPGKDYVHQLNLITKVIGSPNDDELAFITSEKAKRYMRSLPHNARVDFAKLWPHASAAAIDLVDRMLVFDPNKRITVDEALEHPYLASLHDLSDEPTCPTSIEFDFDAESLTLDMVREVILHDMLAYHPEEAGLLVAQQQQHAMAHAHAQQQQQHGGQHIHAAAAQHQHQQHAAMQAHAAAAMHAHAAAAMQAQQMQHMQGGPPQPSAAAAVMPPM